MIHDYKNMLGRQQRKPARRNIHWQWHGALFFVVAAILAIFLVETEKSEASTSLPQELPPIIENEIPPPTPMWEMASYEIELPPVATPRQNAIPKAKLAEPEWQTFIVKRGYNLAIICSRAGVKASEVHALMQLGKDVSTLQKLYPNDKILMKIEADGTLNALQYDIHPTQRLLVTRNTGPLPTQPRFKAQIIDRPIEVRTTHASGVINDSLYAAAYKIGLPDEITLELASLFGWDIDYALQVRKGDRFTVIYEDYYRDGEKIKDGRKTRRERPVKRPIIAAEFVNDGKVYRALRYTDPSGKTDYYTPDGHSIRKTFLRNPVDARVSSHFNPKRRHPLLKKTRPHRGVDYAAPKGTPIKVAGDGKIVFKGRQGGYGRTIIVQHGQRYSTLYAHMSKYARNTGKGRKVKQGQTIGYVGKDGLATGVHLHYEFRIDGVHHNPLTVKHPSVTPIPEKYRSDFLNTTRTQLAQLDTLNRLALANNNDASRSTKI